MFACVLWIIFMMCGLFWLVQLFDLVFREIVYFESHTHKLTWFIVLWVGFFVGAVWYYLWKRDCWVDFDKDKPAEGD